jgi:hypothetical protein
MNICGFKSDFFFVKKYYSNFKETNIEINLLDSYIHDELNKPINWKK